MSRWYGNVVAVNDITMTIGPGVTGLLGPNGAGKSTLLHLIAGLPGAVARRADRRRASRSWRNPGVFRTVGLVPERDSVYAFLTGAEFVLATARLHELADPARPRRRAIAIVDMAEAQDRRISTYSKGMRQRIKVAAALVHDPQVLLLDEPFNGMDPRQRLHMMDLLTPARRRGPDDPAQLAHPGGGRAAVRHHPGDRGRAARRVRRLPRDPAADDQPAARVPGPHLRRPPARRRR